MQKLIERGDWGNNVSWGLYQSNQQPDQSLCTAVFCLGIKESKIILMQAARGWGMTGGHIESGETIEEALAREAEEEGGFTPNGPKIFGYRKITATQPIAHQDGKSTYPFPVSYIAYYWSMVDAGPSRPTGHEVLASRAFSLEEIRIMNIPDLSTIELGWQSYLKQ